MRPRRNGLSATSYAPLRDIDPRLTDAALEALKEAGVAAYAVPALNQFDPVLGIEVTAANRPVDRLYVDTTAVDSARRVLDESFADEETSRGDELVAAPMGDGSPDAPDLDIAFEQVIAGFDESAEDLQRRWPEEENLSSVEVDDGEADGPPARLEPRTEDDDDHFVPPTPAPLPELEPVTKLAWAGVLGGPLVLLGSAFGLSLPSWLSIMAIVAFVAGFVTLVVRLKDDPDDAEPDNGAVV